MINYENNNNKSVSQEQKGRKCKNWVMLYLLVTCWMWWQRKTNTMLQLEGPTLSILNSLMASSWEKEKKWNGGRKLNPQHVMGDEKSKHIIGCTQESFKVPAVVYKYVAWRPMEEEGGRGGRGWSLLSKLLTMTWGFMSLWWVDEGVKEVDVTPWWLGRWQARCSPLGIESWWPVAFWCSV